MRRGNLIVLLVAILMGGIAVFMAQSWMERNTTVTAAPAPTGTIVVATIPLGFGTELTRDNVAEIAWAVASVPEGAFATRDELFKEGRRVVLTPMEKSELILKPKITGPGQRASLSALLESGKRAVTVRVDDVRGVAGFVLPGDRVDVVLIRTENNESYSDVLIENVKVLAVDQLANERQEKATVVKAVTLEATTEQAQKILLASNVGKLSLILRQAGEAHSADARRITAADLGVSEISRTSQASAPAPQAITPPPPPVFRPVGQTTSKVVVFHGLKRAEYQFQNKRDEEN